MKKINIGDIKKILTWIFNNKICSLLIHIIFSLVFSISIYNFLNIKCVHEKFSFVNLIFCCISLCVVICNIIRSFIKKDSVEWIYLYIIIPISCLYILFQPFGKKFDEVQHFFRAYDVSQGQIFTDRNIEGYALIEAPEDFLIYLNNKYNLHSKLFEHFDIAMDYDTVGYTMSSAASYTFMAYIPAILPINLAKLLNLNVFKMFYFTRYVFNAVGIIVAFFAIKNLKNYKWVALIILMNPIYIQQQSAISGDVLLNSLSLYFVTKIISCIQDGNKIKFRSIISLIVIWGIITSIKVPYFLLGLLFLLLPKEDYGIDKKIDKKKVFIILGTFILMLVHIGIYIVNRNYANQDPMVIGEINKIEQLKYVISNPLNFVIAFLNTLRIEGSEIINMLFGARLDHGNLEINSGVMFVTFVLVTISPFIEKINFEFSKKQKIIILSTVFLIPLISIFMMYLHWNSVGRDIIYGFQGRYLIPVLFPFLILFTNKKSYIEVKKWKIVTALLLVNLFTLFEVYFVYL